ncbi:MAG TPA: helix-turn-helix domain-containing protein [Candidatus Jeotgalibaca merdavium]|uniref:Helix-turn-helix domain-containing protein n=1 Tax=Candidatus Jeotgalibaca merdavium TaxID=2838627 RepID=A0A9D2I2P7_9LACT|nr:helix-turn-helix domain-containing protein [Candidatus Jeotgalibaca merdavium]
MNIGQRIKMRRKELGMSVDKLAELINKNRATIYRYEKNEIENMPYDVIEPLAEVLKVSPAYLMGWVEDKNAESEPYQPESVAAHFDGELDDLDQEEMKKVLEYVKFLKSQHK